ncbi:putative lipase [Rosellinia necatrix]|uniref:Putative lipase n=1 Tax=Rosellinia necatrix TaxID=77044 RepID=A0A1W2THL6_ROSNE|nr:putative lipase [Rosellinia necatrix]
MKPLAWSVISGLALTATASPISEAGLTVNGAASVSSSMLSMLKFYAQYAGASYCNSDSAVGSVVTCGGSACPDVTAAGAKITATFSGKTTDIKGFVSTDAKNQVIVLSVRGSHSIRNWITDFEFIQKDCSFGSGCKVHYGFAKAWDEISAAALAAVKAAKAANPAYRIVFTGHSLGAAVSSLGAAYARQAGLAVDIINYGSPRVGNDAFASYVSNQAGVEYRVTHLDDPVPRLPPIVFGYAHTTPEYWLSNGNAFTTNYGVDDIKVCTGTRSLGCNAVTLGLNIFSHLYYLDPIAGCSPIELTFKKRQDTNYIWWQGTSPSVDVSDDDLEAQLNDWVYQDMAARK